MIYRACAIDNFIKSVAVNISFAKAVASLAFIGFIGFPIFSGARGVRIEIPTLGQFTARQSKAHNVVRV